MIATDADFGPVDSHWPGKVSPAYRHLVMPFADVLHRFVDVHRIRNTITRKRRLVAALLAGFGVLMLISTLRSPAAVPLEDTAANDALLAGEVAVPVVVSPGVVIGALAPGMTIDLIGDGHMTQQARILRIPVSGFGPTSDAVVVVAVPESQGLNLASHASAGLSVIIRPVDDE